MSDRLPALLSILLAIVAAGAILAAPGAGAAAATGQSATPTPVAEEAGDSGAVVVPNKTTFAVQLHEDGDATWTVTTHFEVETERDRARSAFEALADRYERGETPALGLDAFRSASDAAEEHSGRPMDVTDVERTSDANASTLSLRFRWTNFAREDGDSLKVDDAFNTSNGTWFDSLSEDQVLIIDVPAGYGFLSAPRGFEDGRIRWDGPQEFEPGYFQIEYSGSAVDPVDRFPSLADVPIEALVAAGIVAAALGGYAVARRRENRPIGSVIGDARDKAGATWSPASPVDGGTPSGGGDPTPDASAAAEAGAGGTADATATAPDDDRDDEPDDGAPAGDGDGEADEPTDEELLSDEERVELLLEENGGRMKQANIVKETGWSNAKVSQLLSTMADEDRVSKLRIGRENLISFPDEDVTDDEE